MRCAPEPIRRQICFDRLRSSQRPGPRPRPRPAPLLLPLRPIITAHHHYCSSSLLLIIVTAPHPDSSLSSHWYAYHVLGGLAGRGPHVVPAPPQPAGRRRAALRGPAGACAQGPGGAAARVGAHPPAGGGGDAGGPGRWWRWAGAGASTVFTMLRADQDLLLRRARRFPFIEVPFG